jgi:hypothetical protein
MSVRNFRPVDAYKLVAYASMQILGALLGECTNQENGCTAAVLCFR